LGALGQKNFIIKYFQNADSMKLRLWIRMKLKPTNSIEVLIELQLIYVLHSTVYQNVLLFIYFWEKSSIING
jgi:hypothetical protein